MGRDTLLIVVLVVCPGLVLGQTFEQDVEHHSWLGSVTYNTGTDTLTQALVFSAGSYTGAMQNGGSFSGSYTSLTPGEVDFVVAKPRSNTGTLITTVVYANWGLAVDCVSDAGCSYDATSFVESECLGETTCTIEPRNSLIGHDPCHGIVKHLQVIFECEDIVDPVCGNDDSCEGIYINTTVGTMLLSVSGSRPTDYVPSSDKAVWELDCSPACLPPSGNDEGDKNKPSSGGGLIGLWVTLGIVGAGAAGAAAVFLVRRRNADAANGSSAIKGSKDGGESGKAAASGAKAAARARQQRAGARGSQSSVAGGKPQPSAKPGEVSSASALQSRKRSLSSQQQRRGSRGSSKSTSSKSAKGGGSKANKAALVAGANAASGIVIVGTSSPWLSAPSRKTGPPAVLQCLRWLSRNVEEEGLFRLSGGAAATTVLTNELLTDPKSVDLSEIKDPHVVASAVKNYLRDPPALLVPRKLFDETLAALGISGDDERVAALAAVMAKLNTARYDLLKRVFVLLAKVAEHEEKNRMNIESLTTVFAPNLLRRDLAQSGMDNMAAGAVLVRTCITHVSRVFP